MRSKVGRNLWGKGTSRNARIETAARRRTHAAKARNRLACPRTLVSQRESPSNETPQAGVKDHPIDSQYQKGNPKKRSFLAGLAKDVLYLEDTIPEDFEREATSGHRLKIRKEKDESLDKQTGQGRFAEPNIGKKKENASSKSKPTRIRSATTADKPVQFKTPAVEAVDYREQAGEALPKRARVAREDRRQAVSGAEAKRPRKPLSASLRIGILLLILFLSLAALLWIYSSTRILNVRNIDVSGNKRLDISYIHGLSGITPDTHLLKMDVKAVEKALLSEPYVAKADIRRKFPNTVAINITERQPEGIISQNGRYHLVDKEGQVLESVDKKPPGLPEIQGLDLPLLYAGQWIESDAFATITTLLSSMSPDLKGMVVSVGCNPSEGLYLRGKGTRVIYGQASDLSRKNEVVLLALNDLVSRYRAVDYIDVSFPEHPVIKPTN